MTSTHLPNNIYLYGPSGSGKSTVGRLLATRLDLPFIDLDEAIASGAQKTIPEIFSSEGEAGFRKRESSALTKASGVNNQVISLGGGALLSDANHRLALSTGQVLCLTASVDTLTRRLVSDEEQRPLLSSHRSDLPVLDMDSRNHAGSARNSKAYALRERLVELLETRSAHYASFPLQLNMDTLTPEQAAWQAQVCLGRFRVSGMGNAYNVRINLSGIEHLGQFLTENQLVGPVVLITDTNVAKFHADRVVKSLEKAGYATSIYPIQSGEAYKTISTVQALWNFFLDAGLDRSSTVLALGGGVVGDLSGFAAAIYLRGVRWVSVPTTLLAMVDASLGGKTGADLPQGKNLVGAFHSPSLVLADPAVLSTLPLAEFRSGLAEVVKHGVIGDPDLFNLCARGLEAVKGNLVELVRRSMAVKIRIIEQDPYEKGQRAALNLGHTLGHAIELASDYQLRHGEAVAIGMVGVARLSERLGIAEIGLAHRITETLERLGLPVELPEGLNREQILAAMGHDKKRKAGKVRLVLPVRVGEVSVGFELENPRELLEQ